MNNKILVALSFFLILGLAVVAAQSSGSSGSAPLLWNAKIDVLGNYIFGYPSMPLESKVVSTFTPSSDITVTRMQLQAASGASKGNPLTNCTVVPSIHLYDSHDRLGIDIPNAPIGNGHFGAYAGSVSSDSGPVSVHFDAGVPISIVALPGDPVPDYCTAYEINIAVQYQAP
jgi:hypothetical protein